MKSPSPPRRTQSVSFARAPSVSQRLAGGVLGVVGPALAGDQPAVDQPMPPAQQLQQAAPAAVQALAAAQAQQPAQQQQQGGGEGAPALAPVEDAALAMEAEIETEEGRGESPPPDAPREQQQPEQQAAAAAAAAQRSPGAVVPALREGRLSISPGTVPPPVAAVRTAQGSEGAVAGAPAAAGVPQQQQQQQQRCRQSPRLKQQAQQQEQSPRAGRGRGSPGGSAGGLPAGSVRFSLPPPAPSGSQRRQKSPRSPNDSQHTAERSTARQAGSPQSAATPISRRGATELAAMTGDLSWFDPLDGGKVLLAKRALNPAACPPGVPLCREREVRLLDGFLQKHLAEGVGGSMYVSGLPGTGKSLTVHELVRQCHRHAAAAPAEAAGSSSQQAQQGQQQLPPALLSINCMSLSDPQQVVASILGCYQAACSKPYPGEEAGEDNDPLVRPAPQQPLSCADALAQLQRLALAAPDAAGGTAAGKGGRGGRKKPGGKGGGKAAGAGAAAAAAAGPYPRGMLVVVLDEMDGLLASHASGASKAGKAKAPRSAAGGSSRGSPLLDLLVLAHQPNSRLVLLGIANDLNLVQRILPDVLAHPAALAGIKPQHVVFTAYQAAQVSRLLQQRLAALPGPAFDPKAVEMCARKVGNGNGDMRLALQACTKALGLLADEAAQAAVAAAAAAAEAAGGAGAMAQPPLARPPARLVGLRHMGAALNTLTGGIGASNSYVQAVRALPAQQQLIMCAVARLLGDTLADRGTPLPKAALAATRAPSSSSKAQSRVQFRAPSPAASGRSGASSLITGGGGAGGSQLGGGAAGPGRSRDVSMGQLYEVFSALSQQIGFRERWDPSLFYSACDNLDSLLAISRAANPSLRRVTMKCHEDDVVMGVSDTPQIRYVVGA